MDDSPAGIGRWLRRWEAVADVERSEAVEDELSPSDSLSRALDLIAFVAELHGWPLPGDVVSREEEAAVRESWAKLRHHYRRA
jgi:hypothetical protein